MHGIYTMYAIVFRCYSIEELVVSKSTQILFVPNSSWISETYLIIDSTDNRNVVTNVSNWKLNISFADRNNSYY